MKRQPPNKLTKPSQYRNPTKYKTKTRSGRPRWMKKSNDASI